tara:strand:- start:969 stop:1739 length:771 start_codon:yes stop_codon:yes gene_type:complete
MKDQDILKEIILLLKKFIRKTTKNRRKKLDTIEKRKRLIETLFKEYKNTGMIIFKNNFLQLYDCGKVGKCVSGAEGKNFQLGGKDIHIFKVISILDGYSKVLFKSFLFNLVKTSSITKQGETSTKSFVFPEDRGITYMGIIQYNKINDSFDIYGSNSSSAGSGGNILTGSINNNKEIKDYIMHGSSNNGLGDSYINTNTMKPITVDEFEMDAELQNSIKNKSFDEIYQTIIDNNNKVFLIRDLQYTRASGNRQSEL